MNDIFEKKIFKYLNILIIFLISFIIRFYNLNSEDFWTDEMFAYWTTDPNISFEDTIVRTLSLNFISLFDFSLKCFHQIFGYDVYTSRYFVLSISIISLIIFAYLLYTIYLVLNLLYLVF